MKLPIFFTVSLLVGLACTAPTSNDRRTLVVNEDFFPESFVVYTAEHDVVNIVVPLNALNFEDDSDDDELSDAGTTLFFVEADIKTNGDRVDQGLFMLKDGHATKLLDNGRDITATNDDSKTVYFASKDGIYSYNAEKKQAEKYGTVTDSLISIAKVNGSDIIYALTEDHVLYKVTEEGTTKEKVDQVVNAKQIVLDYQNNLYYYTTGNEIYVLVGDTVKKINDLPENPTSVSLLKPPFILESGIVIIVNNKAYTAYTTGVSEKADIEFEVVPTAYSVEATLLQYYAHDKKIYEYNILTIIFGEILSQLKSFLAVNSADIRTIATRSRSELRN